MRRPPEPRSRSCRVSARHLCTAFAPPRAASAPGVLGSRRVRVTSPCLTALRDGWVWRAVYCGCTGRRCADAVACRSADPVRARRVAPRSVAGAGTLVWWPGSARRRFLACPKPPASPWDPTAAPRDVPPPTPPVPGVAVPGPPPGPRARRSSPTRELVRLPRRVRFAQLPFDPGQVCRTGPHLYQLCPRRTATSSCSCRVSAASTTPVPTARTLPCGWRSAGPRTGAAGSPPNAVVRASGPAQPTPQQPRQQVAPRVPSRARPGRRATSVKYVHTASHAGRSTIAGHDPRLAAIGKPPDLPPAFWPFRAALHRYRSRHQPDHPRVDQHQPERLVLPRLTPVRTQAAVVPVRHDRVPRGPAEQPRVRILDQRRLGLPRRSPRPRRSRTPETPDAVGLPQRPPASPAGSAVTCPETTGSRAPPSSGPGRSRDPWTSPAPRRCPAPTPDSAPPARSRLPGPAALGSAGPDSPPACRPHRCGSAVAHAPTSAGSPAMPTGGIVTVRHLDALLLKRRRVISTAVHTSTPPSSRTTSCVSWSCLLTPRLSSSGSDEIRKYTTTRRPANKRDQRPPRITGPSELVTPQ